MWNFEKKSQNISAARGSKTWANTDVICCNGKNYISSNGRVLDIDLNIEVNQRVNILTIIKI